MKQIGNQVLNRIVPFALPQNWCARVLITVCVATAIEFAFGNKAWAEPVAVPMVIDQFEFSEGSQYRFIEHEGRSTLCLNGTVFLRDETLREGTITVDVANSGTRHFANIVFHARDFENFESVYLRMHKSGHPDAVQYTPRINGETNWQLLKEAQVVADFGSGDWVTISTSFSQSQAQVTVTAMDQTSSMNVGALRLSGRGDRVGLETLFEGCFSNLTIDKSPPSIPPQSPPPATPSGTIMTWSLSEVRPFSGFPDRIASDQDTSQWSPVRADPDGTLFISRYRKKLSGGSFEDNQLDLVYAGVVIEAPDDRRVDLDFDLSDMGAVYLNGERLFVMNNAFRAKGALFRGDFEPSTQTLSLPLKRGSNTLMIAVAERANGWGLSGRLSLYEGAEVSPLATLSD